MQVSLSWCVHHFVVIGRVRFDPEHCKLAWVSGGNVVMWSRSLCVVMATEVNNQCRDLIVDSPVTQSHFWMVVEKGNLYKLAQEMVPHGKKPSKVHSIRVHLYSQSHCWLSSKMFELKLKLGFSANNWKLYVGHWYVRMETRWRSSRPVWRPSWYGNQQRRSSASPSTPVTTWHMSSRASRNRWVGGTVAAGGTCHPGHQETGGWRAL